MPLACHYRVDIEKISDFLYSLGSISCDLLYLIPTLLKPDSERINEDRSLWFFCDLDEANDPGWEEWLKVSEQLGQCCSPVHIVIIAWLRHAWGLNDIARNPYTRWHLPYISA